MDYIDLQLYIDGEFRAASDAATQPVINPASEEVVGHVPVATEADLDAALEAADRAFETWRRTSPYEREAILERAVVLMCERAERIGRIMSLEQGKTLGQAIYEVSIAADSLKWYAEEGRRTYGRVIPSRDASVHQMVLQEPVGPVAAFTPWNFPALTPARKIGGALAAGCSLVIKGAEEAPGTLQAIVECLHEAGLPAGVLNLVFGKPAMISEHLLNSEIIRKMTLTGSIAVGKHLAKMAADRIMPATLELGGHAPVLVFDDTDVERAVQLSAERKIYNAGQVCIAPTRFYVQDAIYDEFADRMAQFASSTKVGDPLDPTTQMGPVSNKRRLDAIERLVAESVDAGAEILSGGKRIGNRGFFFEPTVLGNVPDHAAVMQEEPFGPLTPITRFESYDEVITRANSLPVGLGAYAFTSSDATAQKLTRDLEAGMVGINHLQISMAEAPFGGIKESGYGSEGGTEGIKAYLTTKFVTHMAA